MLGDKLKAAVLLFLVLLTFYYSFFPRAPKKEPELELNTISFNSTSLRLSFSLSYLAEMPKVCYIVVYGPFVFDGTHEEGNQIYVLRSVEGKIEDTLRLSEPLSVFRAELWCEDRKIAEVSKTIQP